MWRSYYEHQPVRLYLQLAELLRRAGRDGEVEIRRRDGQAFVVRPSVRETSPLDVPGIDSSLSRKAIVDMVRESRRSTDRLITPRRKTPARRRP